MLIYSEAGARRPAKYGEASFGGVVPFAPRFSVPLRVRLIRVRGF